MARTQGRGVEGVHPSSSRQRPRASTRRRMVEGHVDTSIPKLVTHISEQPGTLDSSPPNAPEQLSTTAPDDN